jgi:hypothetical protein
MYKLHPGQHFTKDALTIARAPNETRAKGRQSNEVESAQCEMTRLHHAQLATATHKQCAGCQQVSTVAVESAIVRMEEQILYLTKELKTKSDLVLVANQIRMQDLCVIDEGRQLRDYQAQKIIRIENESKEKMLAAAQCEEKLLSQLQRARKQLNKMELEKCGLIRHGMKVALNRSTQTAKWKNTRHHLATAKLELEKLKTFRLPASTEA